VQKRAQNPHRPDATWTIRACQGRRGSSAVCVAAERFVKLVGEAKRVALREQGVEDPDGAIIHAGAVEHLADDAALDILPPPTLLPGCKARMAAVHNDEMRTVVRREMDIPEVDGGCGSPDQA
jgi:hypothetical protein